MGTPFGVNQEENGACVCSSVSEISCYKQPRKKSLNPEDILFIAYIGFLNECVRHSQMTIEQKYGIDARSVAAFFVLIHNVEKNAFLVNILRRKQSEIILMMDMEYGYYKYRSCSIFFFFFHFIDLFRDIVRRNDTNKGIFITILNFKLGNNFFKVVEYS